ncbi:MFS transporter [Kineosporia sp. A_224]|uniref:MFS transporter n=1 Tax=Kineosporia sp. A_224 TaxID=1962180 RepID=UPI0018E94A38|nr:MFS transporter [Kineosporia sp. A_224]
MELGPPPRPPQRPAARPARGRRLAGDVRRAAGGARRAGRATAQASARAARGGIRAVRSATHAGGAGESGLARVLELHIVQTAGDVLVATALASTVFFAVPTEEARSRVATSLLVTMVPFAVLAPVIGPLLDRVRHGRRYALATTMLVRSFLAWVMAGAVGATVASATPLSFYLAAFGFLVGQKAYHVTRAAAVPRVLPGGIGLVAANSRISLAGVAAMVVAAPIGVGLTAWAGPQWSLRLAFVVLAAGVVLALALPAVVDVGEGEVGALLSSGTDAEGTAVDDGGPEDEPGADRAASAPDSASGRRRRSIGPRVVLALRGNATVRAFTGFLTLFLAFRLRTDPLPGFGQTTAVAVVVALAAVGGGLGTVLGNRLRRVDTERLVVVTLAGTALATAWAALAYGPWPVFAVALVAGTAQSLAKLCLDALVQVDVPEEVRTSAFARSETVLQLAWVAGGFVGLVLPLSGAWGLGIAAVGTAASGFASALSLAGRTRRDGGTRRARPA